MFSEFIWDPAKARANPRKHGVTFEEAAEAFEDCFAVFLGHEIIDGEMRILQLCRSARRLLAVVYTERGSRTRIISARKANRYESELYQGSA